MLEEQRKKFDEKLNEKWKKRKEYVEKLKETYAVCENSVLS